MLEGETDGVGLRKLELGSVVRLLHRKGALVPRREILGEVGHIDQPVVAQDEPVLDDVFQLPDVPRKVVAHEDLHHRGRDSGDLLPPLRAETPDEMLDQKGDVLAPVPERGEGQTDDRQAEVQVVPELPVADELGQLAVGGRHDAHVRLHDLGPAERLVLALLE